MINQSDKMSEKDILLYHYCDANAFHSICSKKKIRLSDIFSMNDNFEIHWGYSIWEKVATKLHEELGAEFIDEVDSYIQNCGKIGVILSASFTKSQDSLIHWKDYGDNGHGFSLGFGSATLQMLPVRKLEIVYNQEEQFKEIEDIVRYLFLLKSLNHKEFEISSYEFGIELSRFKNPIYSDENEVRLIHLTNFKKENGLKLISGEGTYFGREFIGEEIKFKIKNNTPASFIDFDFTNNNSTNPIKEVIVGPKNNSILTGISIYLETNNLKDVEVKRSKL
jgi:Protein of unknown function (DUF2971)